MHKGGDNRFPHLLRRQPTRRAPRTIILFDTEAWVLPRPFGATQQYLRLGWVVVWRQARRGQPESFEWTSFRAPHEFWKVVEKVLERKGPVALCSLNILYDLCIVGGLDYLRPHHGFYREFVHAKTFSFIAKFKTAKGKLTVFDVGNLFHLSAASLGEKLGLEKGKVDFKNVSEADLLTYCRRDVEIILAAIRNYIAFVTEHDLGGWSYTIGSQAMRAYRHKYMKHPIFLHNRWEVLQLERAAYSGGRVDCLKIGDLFDGPFWKLDVNSMYPYVMKREVFPRSFYAVRRGVSVGELGKMLRKFAVIAEVVVSTQKPVYMLRYNRSILCPTGRFGAVLTTPELAYALKNGHIQSVGRVVLYRRVKLFREYVKDLYRLRRRLERDGEKLYAHVCKYLLNSLSGKWGQLCETWEPVAGKVNEPPRIYEYYHYQQQRTITVRSLFGLSETSGPELESRDSFTAIIAHITAYARMYLWTLMERAGRDNVYYVDTDSLVVNETGLRRLKRYISASTLGKLKVEYRTQTLSLRAPKDYSTDIETRIKGIPLKTEPNEDGSYTVEIWPGLHGVLRRGEPVGYRTFKVRKYLTRIYRKGNVLTDGSVEPFILDGEIFPAPFDGVGRSTLWGPEPETAPEAFLGCLSAEQASGQLQLGES